MGGVSDIAVGDAAAMSDQLERRILALVPKEEGIPLQELRTRLEPKLKPDERSLVSLVIYNLINSKRLELTAGRELQRLSTAD